MSEDRSNALSDEALRFVVRLYSGAATRADRVDFAAWRKRSAAHEAAAREAEAIWGDAADLHVDEESRAVRPGRKPTPGGTITGIVLVAALGGAAAFWATGGTAWMADASTGIGETRTVTTADGSRITLNAQSAFDVKITASARRITLLRGEAFFEVAPDRTKPFEVAVEGSIVTAHGTAFDIGHLGDGGVAVAVTEHAVEIDPASGRAIDLPAGRQASILADGRIAGTIAIDKDTVTAWREGLLVAEDKQLSAIVGALRPYHRGWIVLRDPALAKLRVNAVLDLKSPETALRALEKGLPIRISTLSPFVILIAAR